VELIRKVVPSRGGPWPWGFQHGSFVGLYILYGFGNYFLEDSIWPWEMFWLLPYLGAVGLCLAFLTLWVPKYQRKFRHMQSKGAYWQEEVEDTNIACFVGVSGVVLAVLVAQSALLGVARCLGGAILWPLSFAFLSSAVAGFGAYFYIGYAGMANLDIVDRSFGRQGERPASNLPTGLVESLKAEMAMLRTLMGVLAWLYPFAAIGTLFGLDRIPLLFGWGSSADVPLAGQIWFIVGVALLLVGTHATVAGPVHGRHYDIARWLRWREGV
jgi:hypothetical protein